MARLLAAERQAALQHLLHHVLVADRAAHEADAELPQRDLETDVAHHGRDDGVALQPAFALQLARAHQQHGVAVDDAAAWSTKIARSPSPSNATPIWQPRSTTVRASCSGCVEPQWRLMLRPSGWLPMTTRLEAQAAEQLRRHRRRRAVRAIDGQLEPQRAPALRETRRADDPDTRRRDRPAGDRWRVAALRRATTIGDDGLDLALDAFGELLAAPGEHLDAVVLERIVRGRDHDAGVVALRRA